jgi:hypothetical protein
MRLKVTSQILVNKAFENSNQGWMSLMILDDMIWF